MRPAGGDSRPQHPTHGPGGNGHQYGRNAHTSHGKSFISGPDGNHEDPTVRDNMHSGHTDSIASGDHQQHAPQQLNQPLTLPRLNLRAPISLWQ